MNLDKIKSKEGIWYEDADVQTHSGYFKEEANHD